MLRSDGVIARRDHPVLAGAMARLVRDGELAAVLPGVYATPATSRERAARLAALSRWAPDAVLTGRTAAQVTYWPELPGSTVECSLRSARDPQPGFAFSQLRVPPELVVEVGGLRATDPALTALLLCDELGGDGIDHALLSRSATLDGMYEALRLMPWRKGNRGRRALLLDSRDEPWSAAERLCHRLLRAAGITGWRANLPVHVRGHDYFLDVGFPGLRLVVEIDGRLQHSKPEVFESDRWRQNDLVMEGWTVLRFTWRMLEERPEVVVELVREALCSIRPPRWR